MKFRIKVDEFSNGEKEYTPQVKVNWYDLWWENIVDDYSYLTMSQTYKTEKEAADKIIDFQLYLRKVESLQPKKTTYVQY